jgi:hypothetical protein
LLTLVVAEERVLQLVEPLERVAETVAAEVLGPTARRTLAVAVVARVVA